MKKFCFLVLTVFLSSCGGNEPAQKHAEISYQDIQPASGMTYGEFRKHETLGAGDMDLAQKRFIMLDHDNNGRLSEVELGGY